MKALYIAISWLQCLFCGRNSHEAGYKYIIREVIKMAVWNEALRGYVADVPRVVFKRCDGAKFYFDELTAATVSANIETTDIQAGWSLRNWGFMS